MNIKKTIVLVGALGLAVAANSGIYAKTVAKKAARAKAHAAKVVTAKVNINTADAKNLQNLKGIGTKRAQDIVKYREQNGPFKSADDLTKIKGIGSKKIAKIKDQIVLK